MGGANGTEIAVIEAAGTAVAAGRITFRSLADSIQPAERTTAITRKRRMEERMADTRAPNGGLVSQII